MTVLVTTPPLWTVRLKDGAAGAKLTRHLEAAKPERRGVPEVMLLGTCLLRVRNPTGRPLGSQGMNQLP